MRARPEVIPDWLAERIDWREHLGVGMSRVADHAVEKRHWRWQLEFLRTVGGGRYNDYRATCLICGETGYVCLEWLL